MAKLQLILHDLCEKEGDTNKKTISLSTEKNAAELFGYSYSLDNFSMKKQMYQPVEVIADIAIAKVSGNGWTEITRSTLETIFKYRKVSLNLMAADGTSVAEKIFENLYVHEVRPEYVPDGMSMRLLIYSVDKMLTLKVTSRTFVGKKLGSDILANELAKYPLPFDSSKTIAYSTDLMKTLKFKSTKPKKKDEKKDDKKDEKKDGVKDAAANAAADVAKDVAKVTKEGPNMVEHMFPYLVQYNESFYDMLARTTNRWGEFMYFEDGKLQIGYNYDENKCKSVTKYKKMSFSTKDSHDKLLAKAKEGAYEKEAAFDTQIYDTPIQKSPNLVRGELLNFKGQGDKYAMKKIGSFLNTDKNITTWTFSTLTDDTVSVLQAMTKNAISNSGDDSKYFPDKGTDEQYGKYTFTLYDKVKGEKDGFNQFTEITSAFANKDEIYSPERYGKIFDFEQKADKNVILIDYDTNWPGLKLADVIKVNNERFIIVDISAEIKDSKLVFHAKGYGEQKQTIEKKEQIVFYPAVLPSGHVRYSGPQMATIQDDGDPSKSNRVRLSFTWQGEKVDSKDTTPWVPDGEMTACKHKKGDAVMVGFVDGNVERPYVIGANKTKAAVDLGTPGGHTMSLSDGSDGLAKFVTQAFSPVVGTLTGFVPMTKFPGLGSLLKSKDVWDKNKNFEGGFTLSDYYGIYKISGSTDKRNISVSSPWGDVKIDAFTGIKISAPNGDVKITGKNVTIEAGNNLKLESGTNVGWKLGYDKKLGSDYTASAIGLTISSAVASSLANKVKLIDVSILRSVVEVVMRPVEGALTIKSSRFVKLETGKNACEYPKGAFDEEKKKKLLKDAAKKKVADGASVLSDGVVALFKMTGPIANKMASEWIKLYNDCVSKKEVFDHYWVDLDYLTNDDKDPCLDYGKLIDKFWDTDTKKEIKEEDLGFNENIPIQGNNLVSAECLSRNHNFKANIGAIIIVNQRKKARKGLLTAAIELRAAIVKVLDFSLTQDDVDKVFGFFRWTSLPEDSNKKMLAAISKEKCKELPFYTPRESVKKLADKLEGVRDDTKKGARRTFCMNLLKELKLDKNRAIPQGETVPPAEPKITDLKTKNEGEILHQDTWKAYVDSLQAMPAIKTETKLLGQTIKDAFSKQFTEASESLNLFKAYDEMVSWANGNPGGILFGVNKNTFEVGTDPHGEFLINKIESFDPIETFTAAEAGEKEKAGKAIKKFMDMIKKELNSI